MNNHFVMTGQSMQIMRSCYYLITTNQTVVEKKSPGVLGKMRSNLVANEYNVFGEGDNPNTGKPFDKIRNQHAAIVYDASLFGSSGPRKMTVLLPKLIDENTFMVWKPMTVEQHMMESFNAGFKENLTHLTNKKPKWNPCIFIRCYIKKALEAYVLNFGGRVVKPSVKNFQLINPSNSKFIFSFIFL